MKNVKKYRISLSLLLGLFSTVVFANELTVSTPVGNSEVVEMGEQYEQTLSVSPQVQHQQTSAVTQKVTTNVNQVNVNTATAAEIQDKLVGIGAKRAQAIVEYREKNGKFLNVEQLMEVAGIGKATLDRNRDRIVVE